MTAWFSTGTLRARLRRVRIQRHFAGRSIGISCRKATQLVCHHLRSTLSSCYETPVPGKAIQYRCFLDNARTEEEQAE